MVSSERHSEDSFSEDSLSDGTDLSEDLHDLPQSERQGSWFINIHIGFIKPPKMDLYWSIFEPWNWLGEAYVVQSCWLFSFTSSNIPSDLILQKLQKIRHIRSMDVSGKSCSSVGNPAVLIHFNFNEFRWISLISAQHIHTLNGPLRFGIPMHAARYLNSGDSASASAGPLHDVSLRQDGGP